MSDPNYILEYYQGIVDGSITVGKWVRLAYEMIIQGLEDKRFYYAPKKAKKAIVFIETFCHHHEGPLAPGLIKLELWQKALISSIFGIVDKDGNRQFREVLCVVGRKNGKTLLDAGIAEYMTFFDGEYGGRIFFTAPKLKQAGLAFEAFYQMICQEPELNSLAKKRRTDVYIESTNTTAEPLAFNAKKSDGLNPSFASCDEVASWPGQAGLKQYEVIKSALGARKQPLILSITTAGYENEGIYDELVKRSTRVLLGDSQEQRLLPFLYTIDSVGKWNDINELRKSNPNLGVSVSVDYLLDEIAIAEGSLSKRAEFICKYGCVKQNSSQAWLSTQDIEKCCGKALNLEDFRGSYCVGGIDLSQTTDLTACCVVIEKNGINHVFAKFFLPAEKVEEATERDGVPYQIYIQRGFLQASGENFVDYHDCFDWFRQLVEEYEIYPLEVGYDRYSAQYLVQDMTAYGFHMDDVFQGENLTPVIQETEGTIKDGRLLIGDNALLKMHMLDSALKISSETNRRKLIKLGNGVHIDGMAALLDAMCVKQKWHDQYGEQLKNGTVSEDIQT